MKTKRFFTLAIILSSILIAAGLTGSVQARTAKPSNSSGANALLHEAFATLAQADHDYKGHRVEAMRQIHLALGRHAEKTNAREHASNHAAHSAKKVADKGDESQAYSDAQLRKAQGLLQQAGHEISGAVLQHVNAAIAELNTALATR